MNAFVDTSSLFKKYVEEGDFEKLDTLLSQVSEIVIAPTTSLEFQSIIQRKLRDKSLSLEQAKHVEREFFADSHYLSVVIWNEALEKAAKKLIMTYPLKTLDSLQLASGILSKTDVFVTSDQQLYRFVQQEKLNSVFIP